MSFNWNWETDTDLGCFTALTPCGERVWVASGYTPPGSPKPTMVVGLPPTWVRFGEKGWWFKSPSTGGAYKVRGILEEEGWSLPTSFWAAHWEARAENLEAAIRNIRAEVETVEDAVKRLGI